MATEIAETLVYLEPLEKCDVQVLLADAANPAQQQSIVCATSNLLSKVPYFAASLSEPWTQKSTGSAEEMRTLKLECIANSSPADYIACLKLLMQPCNMQIESVSAAVRIMRCADHLLFQECAELCMAYLAAKPWLDEEEVVVRDAVSLMGLPPSSDLSERLHQHLDGLHIFKKFFTDLTLGRHFENGRIEALVKDALTKAPSRLVSKFYRPLFIEIWSVLTRELLQGPEMIKGSPQSLWRAMMTVRRDKWISMTRLLLLHADHAKPELAKAIALECAAFSSLIAKTVEFSICSYSFFAACQGFTGVFINVFEGAIPGEHDALVFLSNVERASLLVTWAPVVFSVNDSKLHLAFERVLSTLPPQDPSIVKLVMENRSKPNFESCYEWWRSSLSKKMKHSHFLVDHFNLHAANINYYQKLLAGE